MSTELRIEDVEAALLTLLQGDAGLQAAGVQVAAITDKTVDAEGNLIVTLPAVLPMYAGSSDIPRGDTTRTTYSTNHEFTIWCGAQDLSSVDSERAACKKLVSLTRHAVAGKRLTLADSGKTHPIALNGVDFLEFNTDGTWYGAKIVIGGASQFN